MEAGLVTPATAFVLLALTLATTAWLAGVASERARARPDLPLVDAAPLTQTRPETVEVVRAATSVPVAS